MSSNNHINPSHATTANPTANPTQVPNPGKKEQEFHILPVDEDKKYSPPPKGRHGEQSAGGPDIRSEFYVGPAMMPGPFISSMGANATAFEREHSKAKKE
ncbi:hypothetical protein BGX27_001936 [Mortierella sp. AM989]|nr:hypothetical protein BGX27_001936 [Mortierella sp. AM989]